MILSQRFRRLILLSGLSRKYFVVSILFGLSTLIIPLATQYLVNSLALSSILANTIVFLVLLLVFLSLAQVLRYVQLVLLEYMQRQIFYQEVKKWSQHVKADKSHYMLEIQTLMKSFSISYGNLVEFSLAQFFGFLVIISLHPAFLLLPLMTIGALWFILTYWNPAVSTSVDESSEKYRLVDLKFDSQVLSDEDEMTFLKARDDHFTYIKRSTIVVGIIYVLSQFYLLGIGIWLIGREELSLGQLVAAEIILSGLMVSLGKIPKTMESLYDLETSKIKIEMALGESHEKS